MTPGIYTVRGRNGAVVRLQVPMPGLTLDGFGKRTASGELEILESPGQSSTPEPAPAAEPSAAGSGTSAVPARGAGPPAHRQAKAPRPPGRKPGGSRDRA